MKKIASAIFRSLLSESKRFALREYVEVLKRWLAQAAIWKWEIARFPAMAVYPGEILFMGRKTQRDLAMILFGISPETSEKVNKRIDKVVCVSEFPLPGALKVPHYVRAIVPLDKSIEELMASYEDKLFRTLMKLRLRYKIRETRNQDEIEEADSKMIRPFARARHGNSANELSPEEVKRFALEHGRLDLITLDDELVGCMLGEGNIRSGKRYWVADRCGYPEHIFNDSKKLGDANSINHHFAIEGAKQRGYDYCDFALCFARPDDNLLQWKRRRGAWPRTLGMKVYGYFYLRLPKSAAPEYLWNNPQFSVERDELNLNLGFPEGVSEEEMAVRYRQMGFSGISKVQLHCTNIPSNELLEKMREMYRQRGQTTEISVVSSC